MILSFELESHKQSG